MTLLSFDRLTVDLECQGKHNANCRADTDVVMHNCVLPQSRASDYIYIPKYLFHKIVSFRHFFLLTLTSMGMGLL
jgi:hypothetical protein